MQAYTGASVMNCQPCLVDALSPQAAASLVLLKKLSQMELHQEGHVTQTNDHRNNDEVTTFHLASSTQTFQLIECTPEPNT